MQRKRNEMPKSTFREKLNGSYGIVITSANVLLFIAIITFLFTSASKLDARIDERATNCVQKETVLMRKDIDCMKTDINWIKESNKEIKSDIKELLERFR